MTGVTKVVLESSYLGSVDIPFTTIYLNGNITGTFELQVPKVNLGYDLPFRTVRSHSQFIRSFAPFSRDDECCRGCLPQVPV